MKCSECGEHTVIWEGPLNKVDEMYQVCTNCGAKGSGDDKLSLSSTAHCMEVESSLRIKRESEAYTRGGIRPKKLWGCKYLKLKGRI